MNNIFNFLPGLKVKQSGMEFNNGDGTKTIVSVISGGDPTPGLSLFGQPQAAAQPLHHQPPCHGFHPYPMQVWPWPMAQQMFSQHPQAQPQPPAPPNILVVEKEEIPKTAAELKVIAEKKKQEQEAKEKKENEEKEKQKKEKLKQETEEEMKKYPLSFSRFSVASVLFFVLALILGSVTISLTYGLQEELRGDVKSKRSLRDAGLVRRRAKADDVATTDIRKMHVSQGANTITVTVSEATGEEIAPAEAATGDAAAAANAGGSNAPTPAWVQDFLSEPAPAPAPAGENGVTGWTADGPEYAVHRQTTVGVGFATVLVFTLATLCAFFAGVRYLRGAKHKKEHGAQAFFLIASWIIFATTFLMDVIILIMALNPDTRPYPPAVVLGYLGSICSWAFMFGYSELTRRWME